LVRVATGEGLSAESVPVSTHIGSSKNLKDIEDLQGYLAQKKGVKAMLC
jgi:hypothetical protein